MFNNQKFLTRGVMAEIPSWLTNLMWHMVLTMEVEEKDYLQVFTLTKTATGQHIVHEQEQPPYRYDRSNFPRGSTPRRTVTSSMYRVTMR